MPSTTRDGSRERESQLRHQYSFSESESSRSSIPMWDSSDPDRAPPPLPLNPGTSSPVTKANTSAHVAATAEAIVSKARESSYPSSPVANKSPDKSLMKGQYHRRLQSFQNTGAVKDLSNYLENPRSPEKSPERPLRQAIDYESRLNDWNSTRSSTPTPPGKDATADLSKDMPSLRPSSRSNMRAILGETSPQSAAMRALQSNPGPEKDTSLSNATNSSTSLVRSPHTFDGISSQIFSLTTIATNLQREMAALSRRSKDNATDLVSLKEATSARDEDIRKSLRDLVSNLTLKMPEEDPDRSARPRYAKSPGSYLIEERSHSTPGLPKSVSLPRIPSPGSFAASLERDLVNAPNPYSVDGAAAIALLEKILREMSTKEGQEKLLSSISELVTKSSPSEENGSKVMKQLEDISQMLKDSTQSRALVRTNGRLPDPPSNNSIDSRSPKDMALARTSQTMGQLPNPVAQPGGTPESNRYTSSAHAADFVSDDIIKLLKRLKDSIAEGGGLSAEIKALVRELRGEVLGMGREIGRKLDQAESSRSDGAQEIHQKPNKEDIITIVEDGLMQLKGHMDRVMKEHRRQSSSSVVSKATVDSQEVYAAVKAAVQEMHMLQQPPQSSGIEREEILEAVRDAWETYKPEIELQNFGLERDEILECLKEGLQDYKANNGSREAPTTTYDDVLSAVRTGLESFKPPSPIDAESSLTREEIVMTVRECLESFDFPAPAAERSRENEVTREEVLDAVKEGLHSHPALARELEFNRDDLFDAVRAGLESSSASFGPVSDQVMEKMQDLIEEMRGEFQQYSAANGRDTEQVLDALKDGMEVLRSSIETYVDRASDVTGKDEILDTVKNGLEHLRIDLEGTIMSSSRPAAVPASSGEVLDAMEKEFEHMRSMITSMLSRSADSNVGREEILDTIREGLSEPITSSRSVNTNEDSVAVTAVRDELKHLREVLAGTLTRSSPSIDREEIVDAVQEAVDRAKLGTMKDNERPESILSNTSELLEAFNEGLDTLKGDVERIVNKPVDTTVNVEILDTLKEGIASIRSDLDRIRSQQAMVEPPTSTRGGEVVVADSNAAARVLSRPDIENLEVMITQLKIKVEALENIPPPPPASIHPDEDAVQKTDVARLETMVKDLQHAVSELVDRDNTMSENLVSREDIDAIETLLRNTKVKIDDLVFPEPEGMVRVEHLASIETVVNGTKDAVEDLALRIENENATKQDAGAIESILKDIQAQIEELRLKQTEDGEKGEDLEVLGILCADIKTRLSEVVPEGDSISTKNDVKALQGLVKDFREQFQAEAELTAQAFESRKIEHGGIADRVEEIRGSLEDVQDELKSKIDKNEKSLDGIASSLTTIGEALTSIDSVTAVKDLRDAFEKELERILSVQDAVKDELTQTGETLYQKHDEHKASIVADIRSKIDSRFNEMMTKYDDAQFAADAKTRNLEEKGAEQVEAISATKSVAEDLRLLVDTLGATLTESCKSISEDSRTVFVKVEDVRGQVGKIMEFLTTQGNSEHHLTRAEIAKSAASIEALQAQSSESHPKILSALTEILGMVGRHFEQSQRSTEEIKSSVNALPSAIPVPALPAPTELPLLEREAIQTLKYDDSEIHDKLDRLVEYVLEAGRSTTQVDLLEEIKSQVASTAEQLAAFAESKREEGAPSFEPKPREIEELDTAIQKRMAQKEVVEADVVRLMDEKTELSSSVQQLKAEEKEMISAKAKLQAELSSIETALQIRREEMHIMEGRAEELERKVVEGVLDHSRSLLLASRPQSSLKSMNLKRVASGASTSSTITTHKESSVGRSVPPSTGSAISSAVGMALKRRQAGPRSKTASPSSTQGNRRILSLSTISTNKRSGEGTMVLAKPMHGSKASSTLSGGGMKRSHSVKSNMPSRKASWGGTKQAGLYGDDLDGDDKENSLLEEDEDEYGSEATDERRTSYTGTQAGTDFGSESYGTGSSIDGAVDRRNSQAASTVGTVGMGSIEEDAESVAARSERQLTLPGAEEEETAQADGGKDVVLYKLPSDSGLGTEPPTAGTTAVKDFWGRE